MTKKYTQISDTAVLIFAATSAYDSRVKKLKGASFLFEELTSRTIQTVKESGLPYILCTEKEQRGATFGQRFSNAIASVFNQGYSNVITIGNDTPLLKVEHLFTAAREMDRGSSVIGPSIDGGFYLMGIGKSAFAKANSPSASKQFSKLSWQTSRVCNEIQALLQNTFLLETLCDIDSSKDIKDLLLNDQIDRILLQLLLLALSTKQDNNYTYSFTASRKDCPIVYGRGSPICLS